MRKIISSFELAGKGLHSGKDCRVKIEPCESEFVLLRSGENEENESEICSLRNSGSARGSDYIFENGERVRTCEHVLSAFAGLGIWRDARITVEGGEMPALDGCAEKITQQILSHSLELEDVDEQTFLRVDSPLIVHDDNNCNRFAAYFPDSSNRLLITCCVSYKIVGSELFDFDCTPENFCGEISRARTFAMLSDIEYLRSHGMALGGSLENAILIDDVKCEILASGGLRWSDEFARHKVLDLIGDLASLGRKLSGHVIAVRAGHELHLKLANLIKQQ